MKKLKYTFWTLFTLSFSMNTYAEKLRPKDALDQSKVGIAARGGTLEGLPYYFGLNENESLKSHARNVRSAHRSYWKPEDRYYNVGFRLVRTAVR